MVIGIEYVCTGNNGRSPMAEAIAKDYVARFEINDVIVSSSGSRLHPMFAQQDQNDLDGGIEIVRTAWENGLYRGRMEQFAAGLLRAEDELRKPGADFAGLDRCIEYAAKAEAIFRNVSLLKRGLFADGEYQKPAIHNSSADIVIAMGSSNAKDVGLIANRMGVAPRIVLLNEYAGLEGSVPDAFCKRQDAYDATCLHLLVAVPKTIKRALDELKDRR